MCWWFVPPERVCTASSCNSCSDSPLHHLEASLYPRNTQPPLSTSTLQCMHPPPHCRCTGLPHDASETLPALVKARHYQTALGLARSFGLPCAAVLEGVASHCVRSQGDPQDPGVGGNRGLATRRWVGGCGLCVCLPITAPPSLAVLLVVCGRPSTPVKPLPSRGAGQHTCTQHWVGHMTLGMSHDIGWVT